MSYKRSDLQKIERLFADNDYKIRYEKGNFKSGYCLVKQSKIVVVNKFFDVDSRMKCLLDIKEILNLGVGSEEKNTPDAVEKTKNTPEVVAV